MKLHLHFILGLLFILFVNNTFAQHNLDAALNGTILTSCDDSLYDSGGPSANYTDNNNYIVTIQPAGASSIIEVIANVVDLSNSTEDTLFVYDGPDKTYPVLGWYLHNGGEGVHYLYPTGNTFSVRFVSDAGTNVSGWNVTWEASFAPIIHEIQEITCNGSANGELIAIVSGTAPYVYNWSPAATTQTISGCDVGTYLVTVTDANGCIGTATYNLQEPDVINATGSATDVLCNGDCDGTATAAATGGTGSYSYMWNFAGNGCSKFYHTTGGTFGPDAADPPVDFNINVSGLGLLDGVIFLLDSVCLDLTHDFDQEVDILLISPMASSIELSTDNGGTGDDYTNTCFNMAGVNGNITDVGNTPPYTGTYIPEDNFTDFNGENPNGVWKLRISDDTDNDIGNLIRWRIVFKTPPQTQTVTSLCAGNYSVTVTDANGCTDASGAIAVTQPSVLTVSAGADQNICSGKSATLTATGNNGTPNYSYAWSSGATTQSITVSPAVTTTYTVTTTDDNGCTATDNVIVTIFSLPNANAGTDASVCLGGSTTLNASASTGTPALSYNWDYGLGAGVSHSVSPVVATTYTVSVTDGNGCTDTDDITITINALPTAAITPATAVICNGQSQTLTASGGTTYLWNTSETTAAINVTPAATTTYTVTVTNAAGCTAVTSRIVTVNSLPVADAGTNTAICNTQSTIIIASGGMSYNWDNGLGAGASHTVSPGVTTVYTVTATDGNGCTDTDNMTVTVNSLPTAAAGSDMAICPGQTTASISASGGTSYVWSPSSGLSNANISNPVANPSITLTYTVTVTDGNGCTDTDDITITVNTLPVAAIAPATAIICNGQSQTLTASGGTSYLWSTTATTAAINVAPAATTTYTVTVTNASGCTAVTSRIVTVNPLPTANAGSDAAICIGQTTAALNASGGMSYNWDNGLGAGASHTVSPGVTTVYTVTATDGNGCTDTDNMTVTVNSLPTAAAGSDMAICPGQTTASISASGGTSYVWSPSSGLSNANISNPVANPSITLTYTVTVTDGNGCKDTDDIMITVNTLPTADIAPATASICVGQSQTLTASGGTSYLWSTTATTAAINVAPAATTTYTVTVTNASGCTAITSRIVTVNPLPTANAGSDAAICIGQTTTLLNATGGISYAWSPSTGLSATNISNPIANPSATTTYTVTVTNVNGCTDDDQVIVTVNPLPSVSFSMPTSTYNVGDTPDTITVFSPAAGGIFSGPGIVPTNNTFHPADAGTGTHNIIFTYQDANGCINKDTNQVVVIDAGGSIEGINSYYCDYSQLDTLIGHPDIGGTALGFIGFPGLTPLGIDRAVFDPTAVPFGTVSITFLYDNAGATVPVTYTTEVHEITGISGFTGLDAGYCPYDPSSVLSGIPTGGTFEGSGVAGSSFSPSAAGIGSHDINYIYIKPLTTCRDTSTNSTIVYSLPLVSFMPTRTLYNVNEPSTELYGSPTTPPGNGYFTGNGVLNYNNDTCDFHPNLAGVGTHNLSYIYTNSNGCRDTFMLGVSVENADALITGYNPSLIYCVDAQNDTLYATNGASVIGSFTGSGILDLGNNSAVFMPGGPGGAGHGVHVITYTYTDPAGPVVFSVSRTLTVDSIGMVNYTGLASEYCIDDPVVTLVGNYSSGSYSYNGTIGGVGNFGSGTGFFNPSVAGADTFIVTYLFTNAATGCTRDTSNEVIVHPLPVIAGTDLSSTYNVLQSPHILTGNPSGGFFTGTGIVNAGTTFDPSNAGVGGPYNITYTYVDIYGCSDIFVDQTTVIEANAQIIGLNSIYCVDGEIDTLEGQPLVIYTPGSGSFSIDGVFNGLGIDSIADNQITLDPSIIGSGSHILRYYYDDIYGTTFYIEEVIYLDSIGSVNFFGLNPEYCIDDNTSSLVGIPVGGVFSGSGIAMNQFSPYIATAGTHTIEYLYTSPFGCSKSKDSTINVYDLPIVSFAIDSQFCSNDAALQITGSPLGGQFYGPNLVGSDIATFTPSPSIIGTQQITYFFEDSVTHCSNSHIESVVIDPVPNLGIVSIDPGYCVNIQPVMLQGQINGTFQGFGSFSGSGILDTTFNDGISYFDPSNAGVGGPFSILYTYQDVNGCSNSYSTNVFVYDLPNVNISNLDTGYCRDISAFNLYGFPQNANGSFSYTGPPVGMNDLGNGTASFDPDNAYPGGIVTYTYVDGNGCVNSYTDSVSIFPLPVVDFSIGYACTIDSIEFFDLTSSIDPIESWYWQFGDNSPMNYDTVQNPKHFYNITGNVTVSLTVTTVSGCEVIESKTIILGDKPDVEFSWSNECWGDYTYFYNESTNIDSVHWDFGDGYTSSDLNPIQYFASGYGTYDVTLIVETPYHCIDSVTHQVTIRPYVVTYPYFEDFEPDNGGWVADESDIISSWEFGEPDKSVINGAASGTHAWCTGLIADFEDNEYSSVVGPCFDFTNLQRPMIKMKIWRSTLDYDDGVILEAKTDSSDWKMIGEMNTGINWYNEDALESHPGTTTSNPGGYGWTGIDTGWVEVRHQLDELKGYSNVRFRILFASDVNGSSEGFAFDDIWIGERTRMVLVEHFTNSSDATCATVNPQFNAMINNNLGDVVDVHYHTSYPGFDQMNNDYPSAPSARSLYYGTSSVPWSIVDGNEFNNISSNLINNPQIIGLRALEDPWFNIDLQTDKTTSDVEANITITALRNISGKNLTCHVAIIEKEINSLTGTNGEVLFRNVLKRMLPNAGGTNYSMNWNNNQSETISQSWTYENVYNPDQMYVVAFIQDEATKEIYQAVSDDTSIVFTSIGEPVFFTDEQNNFNLYPNPANEVVNILFSSAEESERFIEVYDNIGQRIETIKVNPGTQYIVKNVNNYAEGIYLFMLRDENKVIEVSKLIIAY